MKPFALIVIALVLLFAGLVTAGPPQHESTYVGTGLLGPR
jgi:hypothetical protein